ncbi:MAG: phosphatidate cytidylyltransferase [Sphingomonadales bacterium]
MAGAEAASSLGRRVATGLVLAPLAIAALWLGGLPWAGLVAAAVLIMFNEWAAMHRLPTLLRRLGLGVLAAILWLGWLRNWPEAMLTMGGGTGLAAIFARRYAPRQWQALAGGILYAAAPALALLWLRAQPMGFYATLFVLLVVWGADIAAYFTGRAIGGPKLAPAVSPNKTWAGAVGGLAGAVLAGAVMALIWPKYQVASGFARLCLLALPLAVASILGDLHESWLKRRAGVKDSGTILPGHGGVMDRLDGLVPTAVVAALVFWRTGWTG